MAIPHLNLAPLRLLIALSLHTPGLLRCDHHRHSSHQTQHSGQHFQAFPFSAWTVGHLLNTHLRHLVQQRNNSLRLMHLRFLIPLKATHMSLRLSPTDINSLELLRFLVPRHIIISPLIERLSQTPHITIAIWVQSHMPMIWSKHPKRNRGKGEAISQNKLQIYSGLGFMLICNILTQRRMRSKI